MKRNKLAIMTIIAAFMLVATGLQAQGYVLGELIVKFKHGVLDPGTNEEVSINSVTVSNQSIADALANYGTYSVERVFRGSFVTPPFQVTRNGRQIQLKDLSQVYILRMDEDLNMETVARQLAQLPGVINVSPNYYLYPLASELSPNDVDYAYDPGEQWGYFQWEHQNPVTGWDINTPLAWGIETGNRAVKLSILDTGLDYDHYDDDNDEFWGRVVFAKDYTAGSFGSDDRSGGGGHGTKVTGVASAAINTGYGEGYEHGIAGVAGGWGNGSSPDPNSGVSLFIQKGAHDNSMTALTVKLAIEEATDSGVHVLNCSWGRGSPHHEYWWNSNVKDALENAVRADMTVFFATGNDNALDVFSPARYALFDLCCAVGAMDPFGRRVTPSFTIWGSNYGPELTFVAPGDSVISTSNDPDAYSSEYPYYDITGGTSLASPIAAGVGALLYSAAEEQGIDLWDVDCKRIMEHTARDCQYSNANETAGPGYDIYTGWGCVDAWNAVRHLYWPYALNHHIQPFGGDCVVDTQTVQAYFHDPEEEGLPDKGWYTCLRYECQKSIHTIGLDYPWVWSRARDAYCGYLPYESWTDGGVAYDSSCWVGAEIEKLDPTWWFKTYVYKVYVDGGYVWVPRPPAELSVAYTVLGIEEPWHANYVNIISSDYGSQAALVGDFVNHDVPGEVHLAYLDAANGKVYYAVDEFDGYRDHHEIGEGLYPSIDLDPDGLPHVGYQSTDPLVFHPIHEWKDAQGVWHDEPMFPGWAIQAHYPCLAVSDQGAIRGCAYVGGLLGYAWGDGINFESAEIVDNAGDVGNYCSIALNSAGFPHIAYYDATNTALKYAVRIQVAPETFTWGIVTIDNSADVGRYTDIAVDKDGKFHIVYTDVTNSRVKYAYGNLSNWSVEDVASVDPTTQNSICIDFRDGRPVILFTTPSHLVNFLKKTDMGWLGGSAQGSVDPDLGTDVGFDNLGRLIYTFYEEETTPKKLGTLRRSHINDSLGNVWPHFKPSGVDENLAPMIPEITSILPNPALGSATIQYQLPNATETRIAIYDVTGREVKTLVSGEISAGEYELIWEGVDNAGRQVSAGVYFIKMQTENFQASEKIMFIR